ncbi:MAG: hypothetical protein JW909_00170 [Planctomycetes bacterium]|nr:hypothetical protein [Planctomycetota bacterium]
MMSITRWAAVLLLVGVIAILAVYTQHAVTRLGYDASGLKAEIRRLDEEKRALEVKLDTILTPEALVEHARRLDHLVPPGRVR